MRIDLKSCLYYTDIELNTNRLGCWSNDDLKRFVKGMARELIALREGL